jgi:DNA-binding MarR family transcriptional regulator
MNAPSLDVLYKLPGHLVRRCQQISVAIFLEETAAFDITPVQYAALIAIAANENLVATRLSALVAFDRSTLGNVLERLEDKQLIVRKPGVTDRRVKVLEVTDKGRDLLDQIEAPVRRVQERIVEPLRPDQRGPFLAMLAQIVDINNVYSRAPRVTD